MPLGCGNPSNVDPPAPELARCLAVYAAQMLLRRKTFQVLDRIVGSIAILMMDVRAVRDRPVMMLPNHAMQTFAAVLEIPSTTVIADRTKLLDCLADNN